MRLRRAVLDDVPNIVEVHARAIGEVCSRDYTPEQIENWLDRHHADRFAEKVIGGLVYVCVDGAGVVLGFAQRNGPFITALYVSPDHQRRGVAQLLLRRLEADARAADIHELSTHSTLTAVGFYESQGYENLGEVTCKISRQIPLEAFEVTKTL